jgi:hypothetical protein
MHGGRPGLSWHGFSRHSSCGAAGSQPTAASVQWASVLSSMAREGANHKWKVVPYDLLLLPQAQAASAGKTRKNKKSREADTLGESPPPPSPPADLFRSKNANSTATSSLSFSSAVAVDVSLLECGICTHPFDEAAHLPRLLPCGHTFCAACLASWVKPKTARASYTVTCPNDGRESEVKGGDVAALPTNYGMMPLIAAAQRPQSCTSSWAPPASPSKNCWSSSAGG